MERRTLLAAITTAAAGLAGCRTGRPDASPSDTGGTRTPEETTRSRDTTTPDGAPQTDGSTAEDTPTGTDPPAEVGLETLASGLEGPVDVVFLPGSDRRLVAEQRGTVRVLDGDGLRPEPALDLRERVVTGYETGLLGLAVHPEFAATRRLFVRYSAPRRSGTPAGYSHTFVLAEFEVGGDGSIRRDSERTVLEIPEPQPNHNAGSIVFGPDGCLYVGVGDGGAGGDRGTGHVGDWYDGVAGGNGQDVAENLLGGVLRLDVDGREEGKEYAIPDGNPLVGREGLDEHYAWGFRNPWRLSFDDGTLYAGDVGQDRYEEIDVVEKGGNYGWNVREGTHCFGADACPDGTPAAVRDGEEFVDPVVAYPHSGADVSGISVITGNVYRGDTLSGLRGQFVFGDYRTEGRLFTATPRDGQWPTGVLPVADAGKLSRLFACRRHGGELYLLGTGEKGGGLHRLVPAG
jgi:glucose/arabinose dehydrogenase